MKTIRKHLVWFLAGAMVCMLVGFTIFPNTIRIAGGNPNPGYILTSTNTDGSCRWSGTISNSLGISFDSGGLGWIGESSLYFTPYQDGESYGNGFTISNGNYMLLLADNASEKFIVGNMDVWNKSLTVTNSVMFQGNSTAPNALAFKGAEIWSDGTNMMVCLRNGGGTVTTNKLTMSAWP